MKTPSHALVGYLSARFMGFDRAKTTVCVLGACLADLPLSLAYVYFLVECYWQAGHYDGVFIQARMDGIYFENSWLLIAHNLFHSPVSIGYLMLIALICFKLKNGNMGLALAYLVGSLSHALLDVISHINDGPLVLWPLNDEIRFVGLFSHWFMGLPLLIELGAILGLISIFLSKKHFRDY